MDENPLYRLWLLAVSECGLIEFARNFGGGSHCVAFGTASAIACDSLAV